MKKIISLVLLATLFSSCQKDLIKVNENNISIEPGKSILKGTAIHPVICESWKIVSFIVNEKEISGDFEAFTFNFCSTNCVYAGSDKVVAAGKWYYTENKITPTFYMLFEIPPFAGSTIDLQIDLLNEVWEVIEMNNSRMRLIRNNGKINKEVYFIKLL